jgi:tRNA(Arg) A34 adenosine deaminase TadA
MIVTCRPCVVCGSSAILHDVDALGFVQWSELKVNIQDALPDLDPDQRELLMTGTHAHCWETMWDGFE